MVLLVLNVVFCSLKRLPLAWRQTFHPRAELSLSSIQALPFTRTLKATGEEEDPEGLIEKKIQGFFGRPVRFEGPQRLLLYFEKGRYGRLGVYVTHLSIIVILVGGMIGSVLGFKGIVSLLEGETVDHILLRRKGQSFRYPLGYQLRCDDFEISYYDSPGPEKYVNEYTSTLSILEDGKEVRKAEVRVNHPMSHKGVRFYQSSYGNEAEALLRVRPRDGDDTQEFRLTRGEGARLAGHDVAFQLLGYFPEVHNLGEGVQLLLLSEAVGPRRIWLFKDIPDYDEKRGGDFVFSLEEIFLKEFTVLQVTKEPGLSVVWVGCALLIVGLVMAFFMPHQRLWIHISKDKPKPSEVVVGGNTHRNKVGFERQFLDILERLEEVGLRAG
jgi:cytochrome c biogenesis protein